MFLCGKLQVPTLMSDPKSVLRRRNWDETAELCCCTGTWIDLITAALLNTNWWTLEHLHVVVLDVRGESCFYNCGLLTCAPLCIPGCTKINAYHWSTLKCLQGFGDAEWSEGSVVKAKAFGESGGQHLWWQNTFYKKLHSSVQTGLFCLNQRPRQHPHQLFYKPDEWGPKHYSWLLATAAVGQM